MTIQNKNFQIHLTLSKTHIYEITAYSTTDSLQFDFLCQNNIANEAWLIIEDDDFFSSQVTTYQILNDEDEVIITGTLNQQQGGARWMINFQMQDGNHKQISHFYLQLYHENGAPSPNTYFTGNLTIVGGNETFISFSPPYPPTTILFWLQDSDTSTTNPNFIYTILLFVFIVLVVFYYGNFIKKRFF